MIFVVHSSFKSELAIYRAARKRPLRPGSRGPDGEGDFNPTDDELMGRWLADERAEETWNKIKRKAPGLAPTDLIQTLLRARRSARASVNRTVMFKDAWAELLSELKERIGQRLSATPSALRPDDIAEFLEDAAQEVRELHQFFFRRFADQVEFRLSRQGSDVDRSRIAFFKIIVPYFHKHCGEKLYEEAATLCEIAFPGKEIFPDTVRAALRPRPKRKSARR